MKDYELLNEIASLCDGEDMDVVVSAVINYLVELDHAFPTIRDTLVSNLREVAAFIETQGKGLN